MPKTLLLTAEKCDLVMGTAFTPFEVATGKCGVSIPFSRRRVARFKTLGDKSRLIVYFLPVKLLSAEFGKSCFFQLCALFTYPQPYPQKETTCG